MFPIEKYSINEITDFLFVQDSPSLSDVIVVPGGRSDRSMLDARIDRAVDLFKAGYAPLLIVAGVEPLSGGNRVIGATAATYMAKRAVSNGIPKDRMLVVRDGKTDVDCLSSIRQYIRNRRPELTTKRILLVVCPYRMSFVSRFASSFWPEVIRCPHQQGITADNWSSHPNGPRAVSIELYLLSRNAKVPFTTDINMMGRD